MKQKKYKVKIESSLKKQTKVSNVNYNWVIKIVLATFLISLVFSSFSEAIITNVSGYIGIAVIFLFIFIGALFDMIGVAVASSDEKPFHSMSAKRVRGSKMAVTLIRNAPKVSSFCNDVIGDISGIVSGSAGVTIAIKISNMMDIDIILTTLIVTSLIAALTIGTKALGKSFAINKSNYIVYEFAKLLSFFYKEKK
jgi:CBS domain containing-hemolysin-like protein